MIKLALKFSPFSSQNISPCLYGHTYTSKIEISHALTLIRFPILSALKKYLWPTILLQGILLCSCL